MTLATLSTGQHAVVAVLFAATLLALVMWSCRCVPTHPDEDAVLRSADPKGEPAGICGSCWQVLHWGDCHACPDPRGER